MKILLSIIILSSALLCRGQKQETFPLDTSFTLYSAWQKELKHYPFIQPVYPHLPDSVNAKRELVYASYEGREMHLDLYAHKDLKEARPAIVFIHGGGWKSGNKSLEAPMAIHFARRGYVGVCVEYRLSPEALYPAALFDIKTALRYLRKNATELQIDPKRVAISGSSAGGQLAALVAATNSTAYYSDSTLYPEYSSDVQAVVSIDGILAFIHPESGEGADRPGKPSAATLWFGGNQHEKTALWHEASALNHVNENMPPVLFLNSQHPRFHAGRNEMMEQLDLLCIYSEVHEFQNTPHTFWLFEPWFSPTVQRMEVFLGKVLHSTPKPQP